MMCTQIASLFVFGLVSGTNFRVHEHKLLAPDALKETSTVAPDCVKKEGGQLNGCTCTTDDKLTKHCTRGQRCVQTATSDDDICQEISYECFCDNGELSPQAKAAAGNKSCTMSKPESCGTCDYGFTLDPPGSPGPCRKLRIETGKQECSPGYSKVYETDPTTVWKGECEELPKCVKDTPAKVLCYCDNSFGENQDCRAGHICKDAQESSEVCKYDPEINITPLIYDYGYYFKAKRNKDEKCLHKNGCKRIDGDGQERCRVQNRHGKYENVECMYKKGFAI